MFFPIFSAAFGAEESSMKLEQKKPQNRLRLRLSKDIYLEVVASSTIKPPVRWKPEGIFHVLDRLIKREGSL